MFFLDNAPHLSKRVVSTIVGLAVLSRTIIHCLKIYPVQAYRYISRLDFRHLHIHVDEDITPFSY
jgi:hypothetical protein